MIYEFYVVVGDVLLGANVEEGFVPRLGEPLVIGGTPGVFCNVVKKDYDDVLETWVLYANAPVDDPMMEETVAKRLRDLGFVRTGTLVEGKWQKAKPVEV